MSCSFQCCLLAPRKGIAEKTAATKDVRPLDQINALFPVRQRQLHRGLKACHRKLAASRSLDPVFGREPAVELDRRVRLHNEDLDAVL